MYAAAISLSAQTNHTRVRACEMCRAPQGSQPIPRPRHWSPVRKTASFSEFSLWLSRACLSKMIAKWLKNAVFRRNTPTLPAGASPIAMRYNSTWIEKGARPELALPPVPPPPSDASGAPPPPAVDGGSERERPAPGWGWAAPTGLSESDREIFSWCEAVSENDPFEPFVHKNDLFAKAGSGQT
jgi:hypothetical protein